MSATLYLAPIKGVTDHIYRNAFSRIFGGFDYMVAPFISSIQARKFKPSYLRDLLPENNRSNSPIPQILSNNADDFNFLAETIFALGYREINWNLGCPTPMVAKKNRGSGLLPDQRRISDLLTKITERFPGKISIKMRLGRFSAEEILALLPVMNDFPLAKVIIHPRLGVQMYNGVVDLDAFARSLAVCSHPVVYNGDIRDAAFFQELEGRFPQVSEWMIGRGALQNPFLALQIKGLPWEGGAEKLRLFHDTLFAENREMLSGPSHLLGKMKAFWCYYAHAFARARSCYKIITKAKGLSHYQDAVEKIFAEESLALPLHGAK